MWAQRVDVPADGGRATPPCDSLGGCPLDANDEAAIAVTSHGTSPIPKDSFNCSSMRSLAVAVYLSWKLYRTAGDRQVGVLAMTIIDSEITLPLFMIG